MGIVWVLLVEYMVVILVGLESFGRGDGCYNSFERVGVVVG